MRIGKWIGIVVYAVIALLGILVIAFFWRLQNGTAVDLWVASALSILVAFFMVFLPVSGIYHHFMGEGIQRNSNEKDKVMLYFVGQNGLLDDKPCSDADYDALVQAKCQLAPTKEQIMDKIGLDSAEFTEIDPLCLEGWIVDNAHHWRRGKDGIVRSQLYQITWLFFTNKKIHVHKWLLDTVSGVSWAWNSFSYNNPSTSGNTIVFGGDFRIPFEETDEKVQAVLRAIRQKARAEQEAGK